jgi:hypothetical protein
MVIVLKPGIYYLDLEEKTIVSSVDPPPYPEIVDT